MNPQLIDAQQEHRAPKAPFRMREFRKILALVWPFRRTLIAGLIMTAAFAGLHTVSISGAFPVFKILLETEGLRGWVDRTVAGARLGVGFAPPVDSDLIDVVKIDPGSPLAQEGVSVGEQIASAHGYRVPEFLHELAHAPSGSIVSAFVDPGGARRAIDLRPAEPTSEIRLLRWAGSLVPADTQQNKLPTLIYILAALISVAVVANVFRYFGEVLIAKAILRGMMDLRTLLYDRTLHLPMVYFSGQPTSDLVTRFVQDIQEIQRGLITVFGKFIREPLRAVLILGWAFLLDWRITLAMAFAAPVAVAIFWSVGRSVKTANRRLLQAYGTMIGALTATLQNLHVVKAYTAEDQEQRRLRQVDLGMFRHQLRLVKLNAFVSPMMETVALVAGGMATVWLLSRVLNHEMSLSRFVTLGVTLSVLFDPLRKLSDVWVRVQRSTAGAERIFQVIDQPVETVTEEDSVELGPLEQSIDFVGVTFTYPGALRPAIQDINLSIRPGETVALVGPNGCGKTTLVSMLPRLFDPDSGEIRYDGINIRRVNLKSLRRQIGLVSQDAVIFEGTPTENITYGEVVLENGRVEEAARKAGADEFIRNIAGGYDAALGERGTTLSGGQRQRLAIARAVYRNAPILIFDEATSQIDSESELKIQTALRDFAKHRTTLIVAHRLSTIKFATRIVVMDAGRIIDQGTHAELLNSCPLYRNLCETQFVSNAR